MGWNRLCTRHWVHSPKRSAVSRIWLILSLLVILSPNLLASNDPCAQVNALIAALPAEGGVVDLTNFTAQQLETACTQTIVANKPMTLLFGYVTWQLGGNPGIDIRSPKVTIQCPGAGEADMYAQEPPHIQSAGPYPLISDTVQDFHGTDGFQIKGCFLEGAGIGTFGLFFPYGYGGYVERVLTQAFTSVGQFVPGGQWVAVGSWSTNNGGDGVIWGYDGSVSGNSGYAGNGGSGFHSVVGGATLSNQQTYHNRLHGIYLDGTGDPDWSPGTTYVQQHFIRPLSGNPGGYVYFTQVPGTTSANQPSLCQVPGCTFTDGSVTWINAGTQLGYGGGDVFASNWWTILEGTSCTDTGFGEPQGFISDNIRIEGSPSSWIAYTTVSDATCHQGESDDYYATGLHLLYAYAVQINSYNWLGSGWSNNPGGAGILVESSNAIALNGMISMMSYSNAIQVVGSGESSFLNVEALDTAVASTPVTDTYGIYVSGDSVNDSFDDLTISDHRVPPYSRGVLDLGQGTTINNYRPIDLINPYGPQQLLGPPQPMPGSLSPTTGSPTIQAVPTGTPAIQAVSSGSPTIQVVPTGSPAIQVVLTGAGGENSPPETTPETETKGNKDDRTTGGPGDGTPKCDAVRPERVPTRPLPCHSAAQVRSSSQLANHDAAGDPAGRNTSRSGPATSDKGQHSSVSTDGKAQKKGGGGNRNPDRSVRTSPRRKASSFWNASRTASSRRRGIAPRAPATRS